MQSIKLYFSILWLTIILSACTEARQTADYLHLGVPAPRLAKAYVYECSDGYSFTSSRDENRASIIFPEQTITLGYAFAVFGAKFSNSNITLWVEDDVAKLEVDSVTHDNCYNNPAKAIWAQAKLNGVDFRALGNEPSWILEIVQGTNIIFANYSKQINRYQFIRSEPEIDLAAAKTMFKANNKDHTILITIIGEPCQDSMSGEAFDFNVTVELDDQRFTGCGRALLKAL